MKTWWLLILVVVTAVSLGQILPKGCEDASLKAITTASLSTSAVGEGEGEGDVAERVTELVESIEETELETPSVLDNNWAPGDYMAYVRIGGPYSQVLNGHGPPLWTHARTTRMGLLFCVDYGGTEEKGCGAHFGMFDTDQSGDLTPEDTVVSAEGRAPYTGEYQGLMVDSFFDVFVEVLGLPNLVLPNTDPGANETWNFWNGVYTVTDNNVPAKTVIIGVAGQSFIEWLHNEMTMSATSMDM